MTVKAKIIGTDQPLPEPPWGRWVLPEIFVDVVGYHGCTCAQIEVIELEDNSIILLTILSLY